MILFQTFKPIILNHPELIKFSQLKLSVLNFEFKSSSKTLKNWFEKFHSFPFEPPTFIGLACKIDFFLFES